MSEEMDWKEDLQHNQDETLALECWATERACQAREAIDAIVALEQADPANMSRDERWRLTDAAHRWLIRARNYAAAQLI